MQTILGSNGAVGVELARELKKHTKNIRLVSRNPQKVNNNDELYPADLTDSSQTEKAVEGSEVVYLMVGLTYSHKVWKKNWPVIMENTINACKQHGAKLVFFDNIYMYDPNHIFSMDENTPVRPESKKGKVRKEISEMLLNEIEKGNLEALIARAADFIGPKNSLLVELVYKNLAKGKKAMWFGRVDKIHNFTSVVDAAKGTAMLGNSKEAYNQVWHLPTDDTKFTVKEWIELIAKELDVKPSYTIMSKTMMTIVGIFSPVIREFKEMTYQYEKDYFFDSNKFNQSFNYTPMTPAESVKYVKDGVGK